MSVLGTKQALLAHVAVVFGQGLWWGASTRLDEGRLSVQTVILMLGPLAPVLVIKQDDQQHKFATGVLWEEPQGDGGDRKIRSQVTVCHMKKATSTSLRKQFESRGKRREAFLNLSINFYLNL